MDRPTQSHQIAGHEFVIKAYATALEANAIQQAYFKGTKLEVVGDQPKITEFNPGVQFEVYREMVRQLVVSMDGSADNLVERCEQLPAEDFDEVVAVLDQLVSKKKK